LTTHAPVTGPGDGCQASLQPYRHLHIQHLGALLTLRDHTSSRVYQGGPLPPVGERGEPGLPGNSPASHRIRAPRRSPGESRISPLFPLDSPGVAPYNTGYGRSQMWLMPAEWQAAPGWATPRTPGDLTMTETNSTPTTPTTGTEAAQGSDNGK